MKRCTQYTDFFDDPPSLQMEMDNVSDVDNDSGLAGSVSDNNSNDDCHPDFALSSMSLQKFRDFQIKKIKLKKKTSIQNHGLCADRSLHFSSQRHSSRDFTGDSYNHSFKITCDNSDQ